LILPKAAARWGKKSEKGPESHEDEKRQGKEKYLTAFLHGCELKVSLA
jgi:hypothetical protein